MGSMTISDDTWWDIFPNFLKSTKPTNYRVFQYKLLLKAITTNVKCNKWDKSISPLCHFCNQHKETMLHLFWLCPRVTKLWTAFKKYFSKALGIVLTLERCQVLLNNYNGQHKNIINILIIIMKQYIYASKCQNHPLNFMDFMSKVLEYYYCDKDITQTYDKLKQFEKKWKSIL